MTAKRVNVIDVLVAGRVRACRKEFGLSQGELAQQLGVTFQQVQKYEKGVNRIGAGRLYELARIFGVPIQKLFPESEESVTRAEYRNGGAQLISDFALSTDGWRLCRAFLQIKDSDLRKKVIALVEQITGS
jgi:transcriptional regulator with XRE-family HTH domain